MIHEVGCDAYGIGGSPRNKPCTCAATALDVSDDLWDEVDCYIKEIEWYSSRKKDLGADTDTAGKSWADMLMSDIEDLRRALAELKAFHDELQAAYAERDRLYNERLDNMWKGAVGIEEQLHMVRNDLSLFSWAISRLTHLLVESTPAQRESKA
jgi:hypothetical protein